MPEATPAAAPSSNGSTGGHTPSAPAPTKDVAAGPQTSATKQGAPSRNPDGTFAPHGGATNSTAKPVDDDPEYDLGQAKMKRSAILSELGRARALSRASTEMEKKAKALQEREQTWAEKKAKAKEDIGVLLSELELTPEQERALLSAHLYKRHVEPQQLTEEQRRIRELEEKLSATEAKEKAEAERKQQEEERRLRSEHATQLETELKAAIEAGRVPSSPVVVRRIAAKMLSFEQRGLSLPVEQYAAIVRDEVAGEMAEFADTTSIEQRKELLGAEKFKAEERRWIDYLKAKVSPKAPGAVAAKPAAAPVETPKKRMTPQEFEAWFRTRK